MSLVEPSSEFTSWASFEPGGAVVAVRGELDLSTVATLARSLAPVLDTHPHELILDLAELRFIDSTGLSLLVKTSKELKEHEGMLALTHPTPPVRRVLEIVGLDTLLVA
ncbi:MAG TPA: STAS domain-containing protein [Acidimicrobiales bacterium]|jgi:anti-sigma B factor antagonist|nr:STAS domain-containing protein [Acidimicrobiales bacterium]